MDQAVAHTDDFEPRYLRITVVGFFRHLICGFTNDLERLYERENQYATEPRSERDRPFANAMACSAASHMCLSRTSSDFRKLDLRLFIDIVAEIATEVFQCPQIDSATAKHFG